MKKVILSIAFIAGLSTMITANAVNQPVAMEVSQDSSFVDVKFEDLNENVQNAVRALVEQYDLTSLQYNAEKQVTKVGLIGKEDQAAKIVYLDAEGKEIDKAACEENKEAGKVEEGQQQPSPSDEMSQAIIDDGFVDVKFEDLNENVQNAVRTIAGEYELNALQYNAEKQVTRVKATHKEDQSQKTFYLDAEGKEIEFESVPAEENGEETETEGTVF